jgi:hypothetical protein
MTRLRVGVEIVDGGLPIRLGAPGGVEKETAEAPDGGDVRVVGVEIVDGGLPILHARESTIDVGGARNYSLRSEI